MAPKLLFVYGTLRLRAAHPMARHLAMHARYLGPASMAARLYSLGTYPGLRPVPEQFGRVRGDLFELDRPNRLLSQLDQYEGCSPVGGRKPEYVRETARILLPGGREVNAWYYRYNRVVKGACRIRGGDWFSRRPVLG